MLPLNAAGVLRDLLKPALESRLILTCRAMLFLDPALVNGKRVEFHVFDTSGCVGCDVTMTIVDPTCPSCLGQSKSGLFRAAEQAKTRTHVLNGATMVPLVMSPFGKLEPAAEGCLQNLVPRATDLWLARLVSLIVVCGCTFSRKKPESIT
jgi:hypothetical protein